MEFCYMYQNQFKKDEWVMAHSHNCYELIYYPEGHGTISVFENRVNTHNHFRFEKDVVDASCLKNLAFCPSSIIVLPPYTVHNEVHDDYGETISLGFRLGKNEISSFDKILNVTHNDLGEDLIGYMQEIQTEFQTQRPYFDLVIVSSLLRVLSQLGRKAVSKSYSLNINYFLSYIDENYMLNININELSQKAGYSPSQFRNLFYKNTGLSPKTYIMQKRINAAKQLLSNSDLPINEIALQCGYDNVFDFSAIFKKHTGVSPSKYRNE